MVAAKSNKTLADVQPENWPGRAHSHWQDRAMNVHYQAPVSIASNKMEELR